MTLTADNFESSDDSKQSLGGHARAESLSSVERTQIARKAAQARWQKGEMLKETHSGILKIGDHDLPCAVLDNGLRVFSTSGLAKAFGSAKKGRNTRDNKEDSPQLPPFLATKSIRQFIPEELIPPLVSPVLFKPKVGGIAQGYPATIVPQICEVILDASKEGKSVLTQDGHVSGKTVVRVFKYPEQIRERAEKLLRGFARVGVVALVDEATGYQEERAKDELTRILEAYIAPELMPWTRKFPDEFFKQIYRLHGWEYKPENAKKGPRYVGKIINKYIYDELPPGVADELRRINPPNEKYQRKAKLFQNLTEETGNEHVDKQISHVTMLMRASTSMKEYDRLHARAFPKKQQLEIPGVLDIDELERKAR